MPDTYRSIDLMTADTALQGRCRAAAAQQAAPGDPVQWAHDNRYRVAASPGWGAAWASAIAGGNQDPGADPAVITDGMILAAVQALLAPPEETA